MTIDEHFKRIDELQRATRRSIELLEDSQRQTQRTMGLLAEAQQRTEIGLAELIATVGRLRRSAG